MSDVTLSMNENDVRFTHDGRISVLDGIRAAMGPEGDAEAMVDTIRQEHPGIFGGCEEYAFGASGTELVCGSEEWELIFLTIFYHMVEHHG